jgi:outer membrane protein assembly factor BamB
VICSGGVVTLCHPAGLLSFDVATGKRLWEKRWKHPNAAQQTRWINPAALGNVHYRVRQCVNQRPVFAADAGRIFYCLPTGAIGCVDAMTGERVWETSHKGFATGRLGIFGDLVLMAELQPNRVVAYSALDGREVYARLRTGSCPAAPAFDRLRGRVYLDDGDRLVCHQADDFRQLWAAPAPSGPSSSTIPRALTALPDGTVGVLRHARVGNMTGYELALYGGDGGKHLWTTSVDRYHRRGRDYSRINTIYTPAFGGRHVYMPARVYNRTYRNNRSSYTSGTSIFVVDRRTGKRLHEVKVPGANVHPVAFRATAGHGVAVARTYDSKSRRMALQLLVVDGTTGKHVLDEPLMAGSSLSAGGGLLWQRVCPVATMDGRLLVSDGRQIRCYRSAAPPSPAREKEKRP